jgi:hypothetical protein
VANFKALIHKKHADRKSGHAGQGGQGGGHQHHDYKWAPAQKHENNKHMIDGKPMCWLHFCKHWIPDNKAGKQAHVTAKKNDNEKETEPVSEDTNTTNDRVLMANKFKQLQATFTVFSNNMLNN